MSTLKVINQSMKLALFTLLFTLFSFVMLSNVALAEPYKIGVASWSGYPASLEGFKAGLLESGLELNKDYVLIEGAVGADKTLQKKVAQQFKQQNLDLVYSLTTPGTVIMKETLPSELPIVFSIVTYPADSGLIE